MRQGADRLWRVLYLLARLEHGAVLLVAHELIQAVERHRRDRQRAAEHVHHLPHRTAREVSSVSSAPGGRRGKKGVSKRL